jgi:hypothetical protein
MQRAVKTFPHLQPFTVTLDKQPDECPQCHRHMIPNEIEGRQVNADHIEIAYQCTNSSCQKVFVADFIRTVSTASISYSLVDVAPKKFRGTKFSAEIDGTSSEFVKIYNQAEAAEASGYDRISGVGYRKCIEFLVKDYLIIAHPEEAEIITKTFLGECITKYVDDPKLKACAQRATWLGNDETHYVRKWESKDVEDLKVLIRLCTNWIESCLLTEKYQKEMK